MDRFSSIPAVYLVFLSLVVLVTAAIHILFRRVPKIFFRPNPESTDAVPSADERKAAAVRGTDIAVTAVFVFALVWKLSVLLFSFSTIAAEPSALLYMPGGTGGTILASLCAGAYALAAVFGIRVGKRRVPREPSASANEEDRTADDAQKAARIRKAVRIFVAWWAGAGLVFGIPGFRITALVQDGALGVSRDAPGPYAGFEAPDFVLPLLFGPELPESGGEQPVFAGEQQPSASRGALVLSALRGKTVLLNFWATWCPPCRAELPELASIQDAFGSGLEVVAVNLTRTETDIESVRYTAQRGSSEHLLHVLDANGTAANLYDIRSVPTTLVIDAEGMVRFRHSGAVSRDLLSGILRRVIAEGSGSY